MKKLIISSLFFVPALLHAQLKENIVDSKIKDVTVFFNGAQITRVASITLNPGTNILKFDKLSYYIDPASIQVEGSNKYTIVSVNHQNNYLQDVDQNEEVKALKEKLEKLNSEKSYLAADMAAVNAEYNLLISNKTVTGANKTVTIDDMMDMTELYDGKINEVSKKYFEMGLKEKELSREINLLNSQLNQLRTGVSRYTGEIVVNLSAKSPGAQEIVLKYVVTQAGWLPAYDAKVTDVKSPLDLTYKAQVHQSTGEDWKNVKLKLSTGNPTKNNNKPDLGVWEISGYEPQKQAYYSSGRKGKGDKEYGEYEQSKPASATTAYEVDAIDFNNATDSVSSYGFLGSGAYTVTLSTANFTTVANSNVNTEFDIAIPYTIISDGKDYSVEIQKYALVSDYKYYSAPKYDRNAFLIGRFTGWEQYNLVPGNVNIYLSDTYTGQSYFNTQQTTDTIDLSLGRDESIIIDRKKTKDYSKQAMVGSSKKVTLGIELNIKNTKATTVMLDLEDQIPVAKNKEIEVELIETGGSKLDEKTGALKWNLILGPGESKTIKFVYTVKYPKDKTISNF
ncbi:MAG: mucoidy inhibitor MuiA family protein [Bacteroidota bacterium]